MHDHDRDAILARRALFISAALAGFACTSQAPPSEPEPQVQSDTPSPATTEVDGKPIAGPIDGKRPAWTEVMAAAPPLDVPPGLAEADHALMQNLAVNLQATYAQLEQIWNTLPACPPSQAACVDWANTIHAISVVQDDGGESLCGDPPEITNTYLERRNVHRRYIGQLAQLLLADLDAAAQAHTDAADVAAWTSLREGSDEPRPMPCLSCVAPQAWPVVEVVQFAAGQDTLAADHAGVVANVVSTQQTNRKAKLVVRGHADPSEADPDALGRRRAEAVAAELIKRGVDKKQIEIRSYGATLPITRDPNQAALNQRVDFQVLASRR
jgi:outer membrane protein OmpA-like peptidoglycan-associated protein